MLIKSVALLQGILFMIPSSLSQYLQVTLKLYRRDVQLFGFHIGTCTCPSRIRCAIVCVQQNRCSSLQYIENTGLCSTHMVSFENTEEYYAEKLPGNSIYSIENKGGIHSTCSRGVDCQTVDSVCDSGVCKCLPGYSLQSDRNTCVQQCPGYPSNQTFDNNILLYPGLSVIGHNDRFLENTPLQDCIKACIVETSFQCVSIDFSISASTCRLSKNGYFDVGTLSREVNETGWIFGVRCCGSQKDAV